MTDGRQRKTRADAIPAEVHEQAFALWYKLGKPSYGTLRNIMLEQLGLEKTPKIPTLTKWYTTEGWAERADELDGRIAMVQDTEIIAQRKQIIADQAKVGKELVDMGLEYLRKEGIENSADAIRAIGKGAELQDKMLGWAAVFAELSSADDKELDKKLAKYLTGDVLEATAIEDANEQPDDPKESE